MEFQYVKDMEYQGKPVLSVVIGQNYETDPPTWGYLIQMVKGERSIVAGFQTATAARAALDAVLTKRNDNEYHDLPKIVGTQVPDTTFTIIEVRRETHFGGPFFIALGFRQLGWLVEYATWIYNETENYYMAGHYFGSIQDATHDYIVRKH